jgi:hypothetical protein
MKYKEDTFICLECKSDVKIDIIDEQDFKRQCLKDFIDWFYELDSSTNMNKKKRLLEEYLKSK